MGTEGVAPPESEDTAFTAQSAAAYGISAQKNWRREVDSHHKVSFNLQLLSRQRPNFRGPLSIQGQEALCKLSERTALPWWGEMGVEPTKRQFTIGWRNLLQCVCSIGQGTVHLGLYVWRKAEGTIPTVYFNRHYFSRVGSPVPAS